MDETAGADDFALCPECGRPGVGADVGHDAWMTCDPCGVKWSPGSIFTPAHIALDLSAEDAERMRAETAERLRTYRTVDDRPV